jgi:hypothetical protein
MLFQIERFNLKTKTWQPTVHTVEAPTANKAVAGPNGFVVGQKRGRLGCATAKSGKKYRAVPA